MIPAVLAVRQSEAKSAARRAVLYALASHSDKNGGGAFPNFDTLEEESGARRQTVKAAIQEAIDNEEIVATGRRAKGTVVYSFAPLIKRVCGASSSPSELQNGNGTKNRPSSSISGFAVRPANFQQFAQRTGVSSEQAIEENQEEAFPSDSEKTAHPLTAKERHERQVEAAWEQEEAAREIVASERRAAA